MLIKSQDGNLIFFLGEGCYIEIWKSTCNNCLLAHTTLNVDVDDGVEIGRYDSLEDARRTLNDIWLSYDKGEKCFDVGFADARHWGGSDG